jgi:quercetin dioxygenase-like cupin family protein
MIVGYVDIPPNGASPSHRHGGAAIVAIPIEGTCLNQMNGNDPATRSVGDFWYEAPGCHHQRSENAGEGHSKFFAVLVVDDEAIADGFGGIFVLDKEVEAGEKKASI